MLSSERRNRVWRRFSSIKTVPGFAIPNFSGAEIIANLLFGSVGFVAFVYGKKMHIWKTMFLGLALMTYTYFFSNTYLLFGVGVALSVALFIFRD